MERLCLVAFDTRRNWSLVTTVERGKPSAATGIFAGMILGILAAALILLSGCAAPQTAPSERFEVSPQLRSTCVATLREGMTQGVKWVKIHAGEDLVQLGYLEGVEEFFRKEIAEHGQDSQYRVGLWRVMAQAEPRDKLRAEWTNRIREAFLDQNGSDRGHAAETL